MKNKYDSISLATGAHNGGICSVKIAPREWLATAIEKDFSTGKVIGAISLIAGKDFIQLEFTQDSYQYDEKPKTGKAGSFFEISLSGLCNNLTPELHQTLNTLRYHEFIAILKDRQGRMKIVGDYYHGLTFQFSNKEENAAGGQQTIPIDMMMQSEHPAPFYEL